MATFKELRPPSSFELIIDTRDTPLAPQPDKRPCILELRIVRDDCIEHGQVCEQVRLTFRDLAAAFELHAQLGAALRHTTGG